MKYKMVLAMAALTLSESYAVKVCYENRAITDDEVALAIRPPRPLSVSNIIDDIKKKHGSSLGSLEQLNLDHNNIGLKGALGILEFALCDLPGVTTISLRYNRIYEGDAQEPAFKAKLEELLSKETFKTLDLTGNAVANSPWMTSLAFRNTEKIKWRD